jgi:hypothetical protein
MSARFEDLISRLEQGPSFLLLGQRHLLLEDGEDPLLGPVSRAAEEPTQSPDLYQLLLKVPTDKRPRVLSALTESTAALAEPEWMRVVADLPWNGVFSTAVDSVFVRALRNDWRTVQPVASSSFRPSSPRSVRKVQAVMLFGGADQPLEDQPPTNRLELGARRAEARALAQRLPDELITPRGVLVIEAWGTNDWFSTEDLYGVLHRLGKGQAHLFSATAAELEDDFIAAAIEEGSLVPHDEDFASYVKEARHRGRLAHHPKLDPGGHQIRLDQTLHEVPRDIWNSVASLGRIIDIDMLAAPPDESEILRYEKFREFSGGNESLSVWSAIARGLPFKRDYEKTLRQKVETALSRRELLEGPLLLVGQTGTGKTIAMASLAYSIARESNHAVLHISRRVNRPPFDAIDKFCEWVENVSTRSTTLVAWDGMIDPDEYFRLGKYLDSRGRRATVVGSYYRAEKPKLTQHVIEAPASLQNKEMDNFSAHLASLGVHIKERDKTRIKKDSTFLSALYRLLPEARGSVSGGLVLELRHAETTLASAARENVEYTPPTAMAAALHRANLIDKLEIALRDVDDGDGSPSYRGPYDRLVNIVLVASRHGQAIPLELALRIVGRDGVRNLPQLLGKIDLIRWLEDDDGNYMLSARNELEAQILVAAEKTSEQSEIEAISEALAEVRPDNTTSGGNEVQFAVDLLNRIGPQGEQEERYAQYFLRIADAIADANGASIVLNPRLALLETNLCREWVKYTQRKKIADTWQRAEILDRAKEIVGIALATKLTPRSRVRANLMVEQASVAGAQIFELLRSGPDGTVPAPLPVDTIKELVSQVLRVTADSMLVATDKYYPVDVVCWVTIDIFEKQALPQIDSAQLLAECFSRMLLIEPADLSPKQEVKYKARFSDIASIAGDRQAAEQKIQELAEHDEALAAYLYALRISGLIRNSPDPAGVLLALNHLQFHEAAIDDRRCIRLMVDLFWIAKTGMRFMEGERLTLPLTRADWNECLELADRLKVMDELSLIRVEFMRALALFHLGQISSSFDAFRSVEQQSQTFRRRIVSMYVASDISGNPQKFHPTVRRVDPDHRKGLCWVGELGREVPFQPHDFGLTDPAQGLALSEAHMTFNLRGPLLAPVRRPGDKRGPQIVSGLDISKPSTEAAPGRSLE